MTNWTATEVIMRMSEHMTTYSHAQREQTHKIMAHHAEALLRGYPPTPSVPAIGLNIDGLLMPEPALVKQELPIMDKLEFGL